MNELTELKKELARLKKARMKSKDKGFVMDSYQYEDQLKEEIKKIKSKKQYDPNYNAYGSLKKGKY